MAEPAGRRRIGAAVLGAIAIVAAAGAIAATLTGHDGRAVPKPAAGTELDPPRPVPPIVLRTPAGGVTTLSRYRGRVVVLAPFLSLCSEVCPFTTGAFMQAAQRLRQAGLGGKVAFVEVTVDPERDSPARLRAFTRLVHDHGVAMLTGAPAAIRRLWRFFGVWYARSPEPHPPETDWWTGKPLQYDVAHTDALILIDPDGRWRIVDVARADRRTHLSAPLRALAGGGAGSGQPREQWTVAELLQDVGYVLGRRIPVAAG